MSIISSVTPSSNVASAASGMESAIRNSSSGIESSSCIPARTSANTGPPMVCSRHSSMVEWRVSGGTNRSPSVTISPVRWMSREEEPTDTV